MSKMTVLEMVQNILSAMDSDQVDTTDDTEESKQVKTIIAETYNELMSRKDWNHLKLPVPLEALDVLIATDHPTTLKIPEHVTAIDLVRYDTRGAVSDPSRFNVITYKEPGCFLDYVLTRNSEHTDIESVAVVGSTSNVLVYNDRQPQFWTSFDDVHITFDAYDSDLGTTIPADRSMIYATLLPAFETDDDAFVPELPARMFPLFLAECKKAAFYYLKETQSPVDEKRALRGAAIYNNRGTRAHDRTRRVRFGRR